MASQLPIVAKGEKYTGVNFFEYAYPFKYQMSVKAGAPIVPVYLHGTDRVVDARKPA